MWPSEEAQRSFANAVLSRMPMPPLVVEGDRHEGSSASGRQEKGGGGVFASRFLTHVLVVSDWRDEKGC
jgi:hypothetical protein